MQPARHRSPSHANPLGDLQLGVTLTPKFDYHPIAFVSCLAAVLVPRFDEGQFLGARRARFLTQFRAVLDLKLLEGVLDRLREIAHEVIPVGDLRGARGAFPSSFGIQTASVASNDLNTRVLPKPAPKTRGRSDGEQIDDTSLLQIHQHRPVPLPLPPCPIIYTQDPHLRRGRRR